MRLYLLLVMSKVRNAIIYVRPKIKSLQLTLTFVRLIFGAYYIEMRISLVVYTLMNLISYIAFLMFEA